MVYTGKGGIKYDLSAKPLAAGGEGEIFDINGRPNFVAKIYKTGKASLDKEKKLIKMVNEPPDKSVLSQIAWPQDVLYNTGQFVGFIMHKMDINEDLNVIYEYGSAAKYPNMLWENRIIIAENLCVVLDSVHSAGHTCGDFNPKNISVNPTTGHIMFLDTDSYHITDGADVYRCDVGIPEYLPAEVQVKMRGGGTLVTAKLPTFSYDTDNFAAAIHIFQLLMNGVHPFACAIIPSQSSVTAPQPSDNIIKGEFPFMQNIPGIKIPAYAPPITILPQPLQDLFERAFVDGHFNPGIRPTATEWHKALDNLHAELRTCSNVAHHQYYKSLSTCPWCSVSNTFAQSFQPKSTLTQKTIKAPSHVPASSLTAPGGGSPSSARAGSKSLKQKIKGLHIGLKVAATALVLIVGFSVIRSILPSGNSSSPSGNFGGQAAETDGSRTENISVPPVDSALENSYRAYQAGVQAMANRNFSQAINEFRNVIERDPDYNNVQTRLAEAITAYKEDLFASTANLEASEAYGDIINRLNTALGVLPADDEIVDRLTYFANIMYARDRDIVAARIAEIKANAAASQDFDYGITELNALLNEYPAFGMDIDSEIARFSTALLANVEVNLSQSSLALVNGSTETLSYTVSPADIQNIEFNWQSNNPTVATVNTDGRITAQGLGTTEVLLTNADGAVLATCAIVVYQPSHLYNRPYLDIGNAAWFHTYGDENLNGIGLLYPDRNTLLHGTHRNHVVYQLGFESALFTTNLSPVAGRPNGGWIQVSYTFFGDGIQLYRSPAIGSHSPLIPVEIDISNVEQLRIEIEAVVSGWGSQGFMVSSDWRGIENATIMPYTSATLSSPSSSIIHLYNYPYVDVGSAIQFHASGDDYGIGLLYPDRNTLLHGTHRNHVVYQLGFESALFTATLSPVAGRPNGGSIQVSYSFFGDGILLYSSPAIGTNSPSIPIDLDVGGIEQLRIEIEAVVSGW